MDEPNSPSELDRFALLLVARQDQLLLLERLTKLEQRVVQLEKLHPRLTKRPKKARRKR